MEGEVCKLVSFVYKLIIQATMKFRLKKFLKDNHKNPHSNLKLYSFLKWELTDEQFPAIEQLIHSNNNVGEEFEGNEYSIIKLEIDKILLRYDIGEENGVSTNQTRIIISKDAFRYLLEIIKSDGLEKVKRILKL